MKKKFKTLESAYKELINPLTLYASQHLVNKDYCIDAVHEAFIKAQVYLKKHKTAQVSTFLVYKEVMRACRRLNKRISYENYVEVQGQDLIE